MHEANGNVELFNRALGEIKSKNTANSKVEMAGLLMAVMDIIGSEFFVDDGSARERIMSLINTVAGKKEALGEALTHYRENGRLQSLWQELLTVRRGWGKVYFMVAPIYWSFTWDPAKASLNDYTLCQKRFEDLRTFFIDCFETFCRLSVVAAGFEGIVEIDRFAVPTAKGPKAVADLESMPNGSKPMILDQLKHGDMFAPFIDAKLRNGIGHNSAHYDVKADSIVYRNNSPSRGIEEFSIPYVRFCEKLVRLYGQLEACTPLLHFLRGRTIEFTEKD